MAQETLYIVMPAYNEAANIERTVRDWYPLLQFASPESRLVVADSGSKDATHSILRNLQHELPRLEILEDTPRQHGPKLIALYNMAAEKGADWVFQTDSDGQTDPTEFERFWQLRQNRDAVIGMRPQRGDGAFRAFAEKVVCLLLRLYFGVHVPDANAPFRLMRTELVRRHIGRLQPEYELPNIMLTAFFVCKKENICFEPIRFQARRAGKNSVDIKKLTKAGCKALKDFAAFRTLLKQEEE